MWFQILINFKKYGTVTSTGIEVYHILIVKVVELQQEQLAEKC